MYQKFLVAGAILLTVAACVTDTARAQERAEYQFTRTRSEVLVSKRIGDEQWLITRNRTSGFTTGVIFFPSTGKTLFVECTEVSANDQTISLDCFGAKACPVDEPCWPDQWSFLQGVTIERAFIDPDPGPPPFPRVFTYHVEGGRYTQFSLNGEMYYNCGGGNGCGRGFNVSLVDPATGFVVETRRFDTWADAENLTRLATHLAALPHGAVVLIATADDAGLSTSRKQYSEIVSVLEGMGSTRIREVGFREGWVFITVKGYGYALAEDANNASWDNDGRAAVAEYIFTFPLE